jgi:carboxylesterase
METQMAGKKKIYLAGTEPLFKPGKSTGFLFLHGFTASPFEGRQLAERLHNEFRWTVSVPLLPGHGTKPGDLIGISWQDWKDCAESEFRRLRERCQKIVICGQSMGGTLALLLASCFPVNGIITLAGAVFLKDWRLLLLPIARHLITYNKKSKGPDIRDTTIKAMIPSYPKYPVRAVEEFIKLLDYTRKELGKVTAPALLVHSRKDRTIHFNNLEYIYQHISSSFKEKVILDNSYHILSLDIEREKVYEKIRNFLVWVLQE